VRTGRITSGVLIGLAVASVIGASRAYAQQTPPVPRAGPGIISGVVVDTAGKPVDGVAVYLERLTRQVTTRADGVFRFEGVASDTVIVAARKGGYFPNSATVPMGAQGQQLVIEMIPRRTTLAPVVTEAEQSGLSGIVSDSASGALFGAEVVAFGGARHATKTDSSGMFFLNAKPGQYMVRVSSPGHVPQEMGITIRPRGGRRIAVRMTMGADPYRNMKAAVIDDMKDRLARRSTVYSKVYSREDIAKLHPPDTKTLAVHAAPSLMSEDCLVYLNGGITFVPLWSIEPSEIEFMEVYARATISGGQLGTPRGRTSLGGRGRISTQVMGGRKPEDNPGSNCPAAIYVWTAR
jgi:hypothetical protein